jgi:hypothetical protein
MAAKRSTGLTARQERAVAALLEHPTPAAAAAAAGVPERTLRHWRANCPEFNAALEAARRSVWRHALCRMANLAGTAVDTLERNMACVANTADARRSAVEVRSAATLLQHLRDHELADLAERVAALEAAGRPPGGPP